MLEAHVVAVLVGVGQIAYGARAVGHLERPVGEPLTRVAHDVADPTVVSSVDEQRDHIGTVLVAQGRNFAVAPDPFEIGEHVPTVTVGGESRVHELETGCHPARLEGAVGGVHGRLQHRLHLGRAACAVTGLSGVEGHHLDAVCAVARGRG